MALATSVESAGAGLEFCKAGKCLVLAHLFGHISYHLSLVVWGNLCSSHIGHSCSRVCLAVGLLQKRAFLLF